MTDSSTSPPAQKETGEQAASVDPTASKINKPMNLKKNASSSLSVTGQTQYAPSGKNQDLHSSSYSSIPVQLKYEGSLFSGLTSQQNPKKKPHRAMAGLQQRGGVTASSYNTASSSDASSYMLNGRACIGASSTGQAESVQQQTASISNPASIPK